jgi:type I restriction enzyme S subunit
VNVWKETTLGDLVEPAQTWNPLRAPDEWFSYIDLSTVDQGTKRVLEARKLKGSEAPSRARQLVTKGDVLVSTVRPNLNGVAVVPPELDGATASTGFCILRARPTLLNNRYLFHWVKSPIFVTEMVRKATGASYPAISDRIVFESSLLLPPLGEQRRIADVLDQAEALQAKRRAAVAQLEALSQSLFLHLFGNSHECETTALDDLCELITDGTHYTPEYSESGVLFLSARNVTSGYIDWERIKFIPESLHGRLQKRVAPKLNDVLLAKNGTTGIAAIVDRDCTFDIYVSLALLRAKPDVLPVYLHAALNSPMCRKQFRDALKGIGVPNLHLKEIRKTRIPHPPVSLQREFAHRIAAIEKLKTKHHASLTLLRALSSVLQHRAFRGKLQ